MCLKIFKIKRGGTKAALAELQADKGRRQAATNWHREGLKASKVFVWEHRDQKKNGLLKDRRRPRPGRADSDGRRPIVLIEFIGDNKNFPLEENGKPDGLWAKADEERNGQEEFSESPRNRSGKKDDAERRKGVGASDKKKKGMTAGRKNEASDANASGDLKDVGEEERLT